MISKIEVIGFLDAYYGRVHGGIVKVVLKKTEAFTTSFNVKNQEDKEGYVDASISNFTVYQKGKNTLYNNIRYFLYGDYHTVNTRRDIYEDSVSVTKMYMNNKCYGSITDNIGFTHNFNKDTYINVYGGVCFENSEKDNISVTDNHILSIHGKNNPWSYNVGSIYKNGIFKNGKKHDLTLKINHSYLHSENTKQYDYYGNDSEYLRRHYYNVSFNPCYKFEIAKNTSINITSFLGYNEDRHYEQGLQNSILQQIVQRDYKTQETNFESWVELQTSLFKCLFARLSFSYLNGSLHYNDLLSPSNNYKAKGRSGFFYDGLLNWVIKDNRYLLLSFKHYYSFPNIGLYNPMATYSSSNFYNIGNPNLKMEIFNRLELKYTANENLSFLFQLRSGRNIIQTLTHKEENADMYYTRPENVGNNMRYNFLTYLNFDVAKWWRTNNTINLCLYHENLNGDVANCYVAALTSANNFRISGKFGANLEFSLYPKSESVHYQYNAGYYVDLSFYYKFNKNLNLNVMFGNILCSHSKLTIKGSDYELIRKDESNRSRLKLNLTWNFGRGKGKKASIETGQIMEMKSVELQQTMQ
ncbi:outer membrane beta-barrel protein [Xylanibacter muris]|uniref:Outer membrane beta-barrel protein n=1 Tax=Xylanibacter muris TaxID=2736290 RepID=A0ABX2AQ41_9BACT|nr:outer membrane beta-barrel protein [Xylanibacter muris]NPD93099.1 outer membrane beta-barrel protein [Xylanibacter muris]